MNIHKKKILLIHLFPTHQSLRITPERRSRLAVVAQQNKNRGIYHEQSTGNNNEVVRQQFRVAKQVS